MPIKTTINWISKAGNYIENNKTKIQIRKREDISKIPNVPGVYWIETTMPERKIFDADIYDKKKRKSPPNGTNMIVQTDNNPYIIYNGTEGNIRKRLNQHLFNAGSEKTGKLGLEIDKGKHKKYQWSIYYIEIDDIPMRNAIEIWWRYQIGWPAFCKR